MTVHSLWCVELSMVGHPNCWKVFDVYDEAVHYAEEAKSAGLIVAMWDVTIPEIAKKK